MKKIKVLTNVSLKLLCLAFVFTTARGTNAQTSNIKSVLLTPENPEDEWTIPLDALESASYSVSIASSGDVDGKTYNFVYSKITERSGPYFFIWNVSGSGQSYSFNVANTYLKPAVTTVKMECLWKAETEGGGGGGGRDVIEGSAFGEAEVINESPFRVEADKDPPYSGVGDPIVVRAFAGNSIAVNADWSVTEGSGTIQGSPGSSPGKTVSVSSEASGKTTVKGVYSDNRELYDLESLTFVKVLAIEADPEVVCLGGEVNYIITTDPEGEEYESLVTHNEADTGVAGVYEILAECGTSSAETEVTVVEVLSVTCGEVTSTTADPGENETVYIYVGEEPENILTITALLNPEVDAETLPEGCPAWQNATPLEENLLEAEFPINTPSPTEEDTVITVTCGTSEVALRVVVVQVELELPIEKTCDGNSADVNVIVTPDADSVKNKLSNISFEATKPGGGTDFDNPDGQGITISQKGEDICEWQIDNARWYSTQMDHCNETSDYEIKMHFELLGDERITDLAFFSVETTFGTCFDGGATSIKEFSGEPDFITVFNEQAQLWETTVEQGTFIRDVRAHYWHTAPANSQYAYMLEAEEQFHAEQQIENPNHPRWGTVLLVANVMSEIQASQPYTHADRDESILLANKAYVNAGNNEIKRSRNYLLQKEIYCENEIEAKTAIGATHRASLACTHPDCQ